MSDTPRTDTAHRVRANITGMDGHWRDRWCVEQNFARLLERELAKAQDELDRMREVSKAFADSDLSMLSYLKSERDALQRIAERCGAWRTRDGVWVQGEDPVWYCSDPSLGGPEALVESKASQIVPNQFHAWSSTPEAAKARWDEGDSAMSTPDQNNFGQYDKAAPPEPHSIGAESLEARIARLESTVTRLDRALIAVEGTLRNTPKLHPQT